MEIPIYKITINDTDETGVNFVSFVENPAIESDFIALSKEFILAKDEMKQVLTGAVLIPDKNIYRADSENKPYFIVYDADTIEKVSHKFFKENKTHNTNDEHLITLDKNYVVESWIVADPKNDKSNTLGFDVPVGTWMMSYKVDDQDYWDNEILTGNKKGFSIEGYFGLQLAGKKASGVRYQVSENVPHPETSFCYNNAELLKEREQELEIKTTNMAKKTILQKLKDLINGEIESEVEETGSAEPIMEIKTEIVETEPENKTAETEMKATNDGADEKIESELASIKTELAEMKLKLAEKDAEIVDLNKKPAIQSITKEVNMSDNSPVSFGKTMVENLRKANKELGK